MAHHKSAQKRIRQTEVRNERNHFQKKSCRSAIKRLRSLTDAADAQKFLPKVSGMVDKLAKRGLFHKNKANNLKSSLAKHVGRLAA
jgi:small subunit ribosomal protein S20